MRRTVHRLRGRARAEAANDMRSRRQLVSFTSSACAAACAHSARAVERSRAAELSEDTSRSLGTPSLWLARVGSIGDDDEEHL